MINTASTLAIARPAYLHTLLGFVEPKPNATFCRNQQTGALGGNGINPTSKLISLFFKGSLSKCSSLVVKPLGLND